MAIVVQAGSESAVARQLRSERPDGFALATEPSDAGQVVLAVPSPEALRRDPEVVLRVVDEAGPGDEPLVIVIEAAEELRDDELAAVRDAAARTSRPVVLRIIQDG